MDVSLWIALASLLLAGGSLAVAFLAYQASRKALEDSWTREWAAQRPVIYPVLLEEWLSGTSGIYRSGAHKRLFPLKNGGRGPALNVRGDLTVTSAEAEREYAILAGTIAAGDLLIARVAPPCALPSDWIRAKGSITYCDLAGGTWDQPFDISKGSEGELELSLPEPKQTPLGKLCASKNETAPRSHLIRA